ncbi:hypothetical protein Tco_1502957, partial [Tanacetum coccineum]
MFGNLRFTEVGFKWKPTGKTFTIVGNSCPLTRKRISEKRTKNQAKSDKTKHGMEEREKYKVKSKPKSKKVKVKVNPEKSK